jgi:hypothetical protein
MEEAVVALKSVAVPGRVTQRENMHEARRDQKQETALAGGFLFNRGSGIRTHDLLVPNQTR